MSVRSFLPPRASKPRNIGTYVFTATRKIAKNASFRSYGVICLPRMPLTTPEPQSTGIPMESTQSGLFTILIIRNINMAYGYITSARGHELSGRVRAHH